MRAAIDYNTAYHSRNASHKDVMKHLPERGEDPNLADCDRRTPLHRAAMHGKRDDLQLLDRVANSVDMKAGLHYIHWAESALLCILYHAV